MWNLLVIFVLLALNGCGVHPNDNTQSNTSSSEAPPPIMVDAILMPYFQKFNYDIGIDDSNIAAQFTPLNAPNVGQCVRYSNGYRVIQVDPTYWASADLNAREELMYHELGHCAMNLEHIATLELNGCPTSIMYPSTFGSTPCYYNNKNQYYSELISLK